MAKKSTRSRQSERKSPSEVAETPADPKPKRGVKYKSLSVNGITIPLNTTKISVDEAKELLGWRVSTDEQEEHTLLDLEENRICLDNNLTNRPYKGALARRWMSEILRGKWQLNGETIIIDKTGMVQSGQHSLCALVLAEQTRLKDKDKWAEHWKKECYIEKLVVRGISDDDAVVDTIDLGQRRSLGDVIARNQTFAGLGKKEQARLSNDLASATRLVWERQGGKERRFAKEFPHSEAIDFLEDHPKLVECVKLINELNKEGAISKKIQRGFASGLCYMMMHTSTDPNEYFGEGEDTNVSALSEDNKEYATDFWTHFSDPEKLAADNPIRILSEKIATINSAGAVGRLKVIGSVVKTFNMYMDEGEFTTEDPWKELQVAAHFDDDYVEKLDETPRLGGIDYDIAESDAGAASGDFTLDLSKKGKRKGKKWAAGDECWVADDADHWFGTITEEEFWDQDGVTMCMVHDHESDDEYEAPVENLHLEYPGEAEEEVEEELEYETE